LVTGFVALIFWALFALLSAVSVVLTPLLVALIQTLLLKPYVPALSETRHTPRCRVPEVVSIVSNLTRFPADEKFAIDRSAQIMIPSASDGKRNLPSVWDASDLT